MKFIEVLTNERTAKIILIEQIESITMPSGRVYDNGYIKTKSGDIIFLGPGNQAETLSKILLDSK